MMMCEMLFSLQSKKSITRSCFLRFMGHSTVIHNVKFELLGLMLNPLEMEQDEGFRL